MADIGDAYQLLTPLLGTTMASMLFAIALLASGQNSTITGTLAGQIVMEGFLNIRLPAWLRRLITRLIAIIPAVIVTALSGERGAGQLLILSQVILSMQLSFAVVPAGHVHQRQGQDGRVREPAVGAGDRLGGRDRHRLAQRLAAHRDVPHVALSAARALGALLLLVAPRVVQGQGAGAPIRDNSFLIEEAYNQDRNVVQHIAHVRRHP